MYIIPREEINRIELEVKPDYLIAINKLVKQGIESALGEIGITVQINNDELQNWCRQIGSSFLDSESDIYYEKITEASPCQLMEIYDKLKRNYNFAVNIRGKRENVFKDDGWNRARRVEELATAKKFLEKCFPYNRFVSKEEEYDAYEYCKQMDINVCVYCNAQLTHTVIRGKQKKIRPQIDHFFPQSRFPMFALAFYNIVPACQNCNYIKGNKYCDLSKIYHPYDDRQSELRFVWNSRKLQIRYNKVVARCTAELFHTEDIYNMYEGIAEKIVEKAQSYNKQYIEDVMEIMNKHRLDGEKLSKDEIIRNIYDYVPREECFGTPLGELRHDILDDILRKAYC